MRNITLKDLLDLEQKSNGFGLYKHEVRQAYFWSHIDNSYSMPALIDQTVVEIFNELKLSKDDLYTFMDSKFGRYAGDEIGSCNDYPSPTQIKEIIKKHHLLFMKVIYEVRSF